MVLNVDRLQSSQVEVEVECFGSLILNGDNMKNDIEGVVGSTLPLGN